MSAKILIKRQSISEFVTDALAASPKSQKEIASEIGLDNANVVTMWKSGASRVPPNRLYALALALDVDPWFLVRLGMLEYYPEVHAVIEKIMPAPLLTKNEIEMLKSYRKLTDYSDVPFLFHGPETTIVASYVMSRSVSPSPTISIS